MLTYGGGRGRGACARGDGEWLVMRSLLGEGLPRVVARDIEVDELDVGIVILTKGETFFTQELTARDAGITSIRVKQF